MCIDTRIDMRIDECFEISIGTGIDIYRRGDGHRAVGRSMVMAIVKAYMVMAYIFVAYVGVAMDIEQWPIVQSFALEESRRQVY